MSAEDAFRAAAGDAESTASALRDKAEMLESANDHAKASVYYNAAAKREQEAKTWRSLLK
jgi:hypothetical protein